MNKHSAVSLLLFACLVILANACSEEPRGYYKKDFRFLIHSSFNIPSGNEMVVAVSGIVQSGKVEVGDELVLETENGDVVIKPLSIQLANADGVKELKFAVPPNNAVGMTFKGLDKSVFVSGKVIKAKRDD